MGGPPVEESFDKDVSLYVKFAGGRKFLSRAARGLIRRIFPALAAFIFTLAAGPAHAAESIFTRGTLTLVHGEFRATLRVEVADTSEERSLGLMYRAVLPKDAGMLFIYPKSDWRSFWMKNTRIPLSLAYISADWRITEIVRMNPLRGGVKLPGWVPRTYPSKKSVRYALEVNQGWFKRNGIGPGAEVSFEEEEK